MGFLSGFIVVGCLAPNYGAAAAKAIAESRQSGMVVVREGLAYRRPDLFRQPLPPHAMDSHEPRSRRYRRRHVRVTLQ